MRDCSRLIQDPIRTAHNSTDAHHLLSTPTTYQCWSYGSFTQPDQGGSALCLFLGTELVKYGLTHHKAHSPFQMETMALLYAVQAAAATDVNDCTFYMDSDLLVKTHRSSDTLQFADWQAYSDLMQLSLLLMLHPQYKCVFIPREEVYSGT